MKKFLVLFILITGLSSSAFALNLAVGGNVNLGGSLSTDQRFQGMTAGGGAFVNLDFFLGLGVQAEVNVTVSHFLVSTNTIWLMTDYTVLDVPVMLWWNLPLGPIIVGGGAGLNLSILDADYASAKVALGFAAGANVIFRIGKHFGLVTGVHGLFDFMPRFSVTGYPNAVAYTFTPSDWTRKAIYGNLGLEYRF